MYRFNCCVAVAVAGLGGQAVAGVITVPGDQPTIQAGINAAIDGDEVIVSPGTYNENVRIINKAITLRSSDGPEVTTIDGVSEDVVWISGPLAPNLDGFTIIRSGEDSRILRVESVASSAITNCRFPSIGDDIGATIHSGSTSALTDCVFEGLRHAADVFDNSAVTFLRCSFLNNADQGAIAVISNSDVNITECTFTGNEADRGGAVYIANNSRVTITASTFIDNLTSSFGEGGAIYVDNGSVLNAFNCLFVHNQAFFGGAISFHPGGFEIPQLIVGCTIYENMAGNGGGLILANGTLLTIRNSIVRDNVPGQIVGDAFSVTDAIFCNINGGWPGVGNINGHPQFVDPGNGDYRLQSGSPSIDAGNNWGTVGITDTDLDGNPRFADDPATVDTGCSVPAVVDMGAFEFQGTPATVKLGDIDGDGAVAVPDLLRLLAAWGPTGGCADFDLDGVVGVPDLLILLANWG